MKLYLKNARLNFTANLFQPQLGPDGKGKAKFSVVSIIDSKTQAFAGEMNPDSAKGRESGFSWVTPRDAISSAIIDAAKRQPKWGEKFMDVIKQLKAADRLPVHDGEAKADKPGYAGSIYINSSNEVRPQVTNSRTGGQLEAKDGVIYSGCRAYVTLDIWAQDNSFGKRINASLLMVSFLGDDERISGGATATADDYAAIPDVPEKSKSGAASLF